MKKILFFLIVFFIHKIVQCQNLVPDGSFEQDTACPLTTYVYYNAYWKVPTAGTPDYFDTCSNSWTNSVPNNFVGSQPAFGGAYVGLVTKIAGDYKEYVQVRLLDSLKAGISYCVSYYVSLAGKSAYATPAPQLYFSDSAISSTGSSYFPYTPQINNTSIITDTTNWTHITGTYTANGGEKYITIGNFFSDANTPSVFINFSSIMAYFYLDSVSVVNCDSSNGVNEQTFNIKINIFPNPFSAQTTLKTDIPLVNVTLTVDNCFGQTVAQIKNINGQTVVFSRDNLTSGLYFVRLTEENKIIAVDKLVITD
jgi:hypothetical protein